MEKPENRQKNLTNTPTGQSDSTQRKEKALSKEQMQAVRRNYLRLWGRGHLREDLQKLSPEELARLVDREVLHLPEKK